ncbi:MAG: phosphorylase [Cyanobacteriota bacterium]
MNRKHVITDPSKLVRIELRNQGFDLDKVNMPKRVYMFADSLYDEILNRNVGEYKFSLGGELYVFKNNNNIGFIKSAMCSPAMAIQTEELVACGVKELIHIGFAGGIKNDIKIGELIITDGAYNDTGIARLYGFDEKIIYSNEELSQEIKILFENDVIKTIKGLHWTTDAGYHETWGQIMDYREKNALCVEMEGVGLFTIARYHNIKATGVYIISDIFNEDGWCLGWNESKISAVVSRVISTIIKSIEKNHTL